MKNNQSIKKRFSTLIIVLILMLNSALAQDNTLFFMDKVPQAISLNPAIQYSCKNYIELPVISSIKFGYNNTGFGYHDFIHYGTVDMADSIIFDFKNLEKKLKPVNYLRLNLNLNILGFGFAYKDMFFSLNISNNTEARVGFAKGIISSFTAGNWNIDGNEPVPIDLSGIGVDAINYTSFAFGASKRMSSQLTLGFKLKWLWGTANFNTRQSDFILNTERNPIALTVTSQYVFNASFPVELQYDSLGLVDNAEVNIDNPVKTFILNKNRGWGLDVGAIYEVSDRLTLSASAIDLGYINWKTNATTYREDGYFKFIGIDLDLYDLQDADETLIGNLVDSIRNSFKLQHSNEAYKTFLIPKIFVGITYDLTRWLNFGVLSKTEIYDKKPHTSATLSLNVRPVNFISASVSFSAMNNSYNNLGFGLAIGNRGVQLYLVTDNIPLKFVKIANTPMLFPYNARSINFRLGLNVIFGCQQKGSKNRGAKGRGGHINPVCPAYR